MLHGLPRFVPDTSRSSMECQEALWKIKKLVRKVKRLYGILSSFHGIPRNF